MTLVPGLSPCSAAQREGISGLTLPLCVPLNDLWKPILHYHLIQLKIFLSLSHSHLQSSLQPLFSSSWIPGLQGNKRKKTSLWAGELGNKFRTVTSVLGNKHWNPGGVVILWEHWERADWAPATPLPELGKSNPSMEKGRTYLMLSSSTWDSRGSLDRSAGSSFLSLTHEGRLGWAVDSTTGGWAVDSTAGWSFSKTANQFWQHTESISRNTK